MESQCPPAPTCTHLHPPAHTCTHLHPPAPMCLNSQEHKVGHSLEMYVEPVHYWYVRHEWQFRNVENQREINVRQSVLCSFHWVQGTAKISYEP